MSISEHDDRFDDRFDEDGVAFPGAFAISTVGRLGMKDDGRLVPVVRSAICDVCGSWASDLSVARSSTKSPGEDVSDVRISRHSVTVVYACPAHSEQVSIALCEEFGGSSNTYDADIDDLTRLVERFAKERIIG